MMEEYTRRRNAMAAVFDELGVTYSMPRGAFYFWANISGSGRLVVRVLPARARRPRDPLLPRLDVRRRGRGLRAHLVPRAAGHSSTRRSSASPACTANARAARDVRGRARPSADDERPGGCAPRRADRGAARRVRAGAARRLARVVERRRPRGRERRASSATATSGRPSSSRRRSCGGSCGSTPAGDRRRRALRVARHRRRGRVVGVAEERGRARRDGDARAAEAAAARRASGCAPAS